MIKLQENCTGCGSCKSFCPTGAISIYEDSFGEIVRNIDQGKCINCGLCYKLCPLNEVVLEKTKCAYAATSRIFELRKHGASGGIASSFYKYGLKNDYICIGAVYEKNRVIYKQLTSDDDIIKNEPDYFTRKVLFIGLPCHCAAVKKIFEKYGIKAIYIDIVCNGVCSDNALERELLLNGYLDLSKIEDVRFREKNNQYGISILDGNRNVIKKIPKESSEYMKLYEKRKNIYNNCKNCIYAQKYRVGDITLKDYVWKYGISNVLVNTLKGVEFIEQTSEYLYLQQYSIKKVMEEDERLG